MLIVQDYNQKTVGYGFLCFILIFLFPISFRKGLWYLQSDYEFYQYSTLITGIKPLAKEH